MIEILSSNYDRESFILIVDDDQTLLKFFKIHLNKFFSHVMVVKNAKEAIDTLKEKTIDLVVSDIRMPKVDGFQLVKKIRSQDPSIPVVLVSGAMLSEEQIEDCEKHVDGFLRKPFSVDDLHKVITRGMERRKILKELRQLIPDNKTFMDIVYHQKSPKKVLEELESENLIREKMDLLKIG